MPAKRILRICSRCLEPDRPGRRVTTSGICRWCAEVIPKKQRDLYRWQRKTLTKAS